MTTTRSIPPFRMPATGGFASPVQRTSVIEWCVASRALPGEARSGDLHIIAPWSDGVLVAVVDGLGHGEEATFAAQAAVKTVEQHAGPSVVSVVQQCHAALRHTRGVVMSAISIDTREQTVAVIGIGDVETVVLRANPRAKPQRQSALLRGGVVGYQLPALQPDVLPIAVDDVIVFATDGVREDFGDLLNVADPLPLTVERVITQNFRGTDDGLVLALKFVGGS